jgi:2-polyprenyl-3-methyl-5-hydroxy-6-metoxy-1,4-benzoquinol methylase
MSPERISWEEAVQWLKSQPDRGELVRHCYYDDPVEQAAERFHRSEEWGAVCRLLADYLPEDVLDIGAGRGISSYAFAREGCNVIALEPDTSAIVGSGAIAQLAESTGTTISINSEFAEKLVFADGQFGIVYGRAVLHHAKDLAQLCKEAARVLRPGGVFLATREHVVSSAQELSVFLAQHPLHSLYGGENAYSLEQYIGAIGGAGLKLRKVIGPFESVINYAPMSKSEFESQVVGALSPRVGTRLARVLSRLPGCKRLYATYRSRTYATPGRHYSFLATK